MTLSWTEVQAMAERAALGAKVPFAQAARFGAAAARHIAEGRTAKALVDVLNDPEQIIALSTEVERAVESASSLGRSHLILQEPRELAASFFQSLPCDAKLELLPEGLKATVLLNDPQRRRRVTHLDVPDDLWMQMEALATGTHLPHGEMSPKRGVGAGLMQLD